MLSSIRTKLYLTIVGVTIPALILVGVLSYLGGRAAVEKATLEHLTSVRADKATQIESYFDQIRAQARTLARNLMVTEALIEFDAAYEALETAELTTDQRQAVLGHYEDEFLPRLEGHTDEPIDAASLLPAASSELYLQYNYIAANPHPVGEKRGLDDADDGSVYSAVHNRIHPILRDFADEFGFYDLILISGSGKVVYTVEKEVDLGTDLVDGPYRDSNLAAVFLQARRDVADHRVRLVDFAQYVPSLGEPAAFVAAPIVDNAQLLGVLVLQIPIGEIDRVMTDDRQWRQQGLGETGETYLVGQDRRLRSNSRFFLEDPESYFSRLEAAGVAASDLRRIRCFGTSILLQEVDSPAVREALEGATATSITIDSQPCVLSPKAIGHCEATSKANAIRASNIGRWGYLLRSNMIFVSESASLKTFANLSKQRVTRIHTVPLRHSDATMLLPQILSPATIVPLRRPRR